MDSETKEMKQELAIKMEDEDQAVDIAQMAPAFQAEGSAQAGGSTQGNRHPPTLAEMTASSTLELAPHKSSSNLPSPQEPIEYRRYVSFLADNMPPAPPNLYGDDFQKWQHSHLLTATLDHLVEVFKDEDKPQEEAYGFYQDWLVVNNWDYKDSPFWSWASAKGPFGHAATLRRKCKKMAGDWVGKEGEGDGMWEGVKEEEHT